jgi:hypothetical protein
MPRKILWPAMAVAALGCASRPQPSACPVDESAPRFTITASDAAGTLDPATLTRISRGVAAEWGDVGEQKRKRYTQDEDLIHKLPHPEVFRLGRLRPRAGDSALVRLVYTGGWLRIPTLLSASRPEVGRHMLAAAVAAMEHAQEGMVMRDTVPLNLPQAPVVFLVARWEAQPNRVAARFAIAESKVRPVNASNQLHYPEVERRLHSEAELLLAFIVRKDSTVDTATVRILETASGEFLRTIHNAMPRFRYVPATLDCRPLDQAVRQPFNFKIVR